MAGTWLLSLPWGRTLKCGASLSDAALGWFCCRAAVSLTGEASLRCRLAQGRLKTTNYCIFLYNFLLWFLNVESIYVLLALPNAN